MRRGRSPVGPPEVLHGRVPASGSESTGIVLGLGLTIGQRRSSSVGSGVVGHCHEEVDAHELASTLAPERSQASVIVTTGVDDDRGYAALSDGQQGRIVSCNVYTWTTHRPMCNYIALACVK